MAKKTGNKNTGLMNWDAKLAAEAAIAVGMEAGVGTGENFSIKGGILSFNGAPVENNEMGVVILDHILMNANYPDAFDPKNPSGPNCFAFGRSEAEMKPHQTCVDAGTAQAEDCASCPLNQWGTADRGKGKACGNGRRLGLISAGEFGKDGSFKMERDPKHYETAGIGYLKLPPTSIKPWAAFVKSLAATLGRPPHGIVTRIRVDRDQEDSMKIVCEPLDKLPDNVMGVVMARHAEAMKMIEFPFPKYEGGAGSGRKAAPRSNPRQPAGKLARPAAKGFGKAKPAPKAAPRPAKAAPAPRQAARPAAKAAAPMAPRRQSKF